MNQTETENTTAKDSSDAGMPLVMNRDEFWKELEEINDDLVSMDSEFGLEDNLKRRVDYVVGRLTSLQDKVLNEYVNWMDKLQLLLTEATELASATKEMMDHLREKESDLPSWNETNRYISALIGRIHRYS